VSRKRVVRLMQEEGLKARVRKRFTCSTMSDHDQPVAANVVNRQFTAARANQRWVGDTTEFGIGESGQLYLAAILDLFSRFTVGWAVSAVNDRHLTSRRSRWQQTKGAVADLSPSALVVVGREKRTFSENQITKIRQGGDPLWTGAAIGAGIGFASLALLLRSNCPCDADYYAGEWIAPTLLIGGGVGAGIGLAVDATVNRGVMIFQRTSATKTNINLSPILFGERRGLFMTVRF